MKPRAAAPLKRTSCCWESWRGTWRCISQSPVPPRREHSRTPGQSQTNCRISIPLAYFILFYFLERGEGRETQMCKGNIHQWPFKRPLLALNSLSHTSQGRCASGLKRNISDRRIQVTFSMTSRWEFGFERPQKEEYKHPGNERRTVAVPAMAS